MLFISFYTRNTPYESVMKQYLKPSLERFNLNYDIIEVEDLGSWNLNTRYKAKIIKQALLKYKENVCFIDADGEILKFPELLFNIPDKYDIAIHQLDWQKFWHNKSNQTQREWLSGTLYMKYSKKNLELIDQWIQKDIMNKNAKEQKNFEELVINNPKYQVYDLPVFFCAIKKRDGTIPEYVGEPIILHHQVSRDYKNRK